MRSELRSILAFLAGLAAAGALAGCGAPRDPEQDHRNQEARLIKLIDERRYQDVIRIVERSDGKAEASAEFPHLLAMAYLGEAGFEPLRFAAKVIAAQASPSAPGPDGLARLLPGCEPSDARALRRFEQLPTRCLLKRVWAHVPDPDHPSFAKARALFRSSYPDARATSTELNTLIAVVEAASALGRVRGLLAPRAEARWGDAVLLAEIAFAANDARQALDRARYAARAVSKLVTGLDYGPLFAPDAAGRLNWLEDTGMPLLLEFGMEPGAKDIAEARALIERIAARIRGP